MKKIIPITIVFVIIVLLGAVFWLLSKNIAKENSTLTESSAKPTEVFPVDYYTGKVSVMASGTPKTTLNLENESSVSANDFRALPNVTNLGEGFYHLDGSSPDIKLPYSILFAQNDQSFSVSLDAKPLADARKRFSYDFLKLMEITEKDACQLKVFVSVTYYVDEKLAGSNLGLSFCSGNVPL